MKKKQNSEIFLRLSGANFRKPLIYIVNNNLAPATVVCELAVTAILHLSYIVIDVIGAKGIGRHFATIK